MEKPKYYILTELWVPKFLITWHTLMLLIGLIFIGLPDGMIFPILGAVFSYASFYGVREVLEFQHKNKGHMSRELFDSAVFFFWIFTILVFLMFIISLIIPIFKGDFMIVNAGIYLLSFFPSSLGGALGACKAWEVREVFESKYN
ncbi:MAG TPA: hypothetical protein DEO59_17500 [Balneola sp.]|jgi:hypothetical protein|nr:hypothetical protein [Balneola sp.]MBF64174.1 hypothetical protein [Balneola sp.]HAW78359.1 hypothetical protein [Balneola sp.]HBZ40178.1 hypothetical protein [Balneola sp.]|tara:strand:- start:897 stop:1331 length:435 start_codon:yes stop_codon:yes gene_type:complete